ncbi:VOC family protein [Ornithinimicrobium faecis]|uniref:VOC family protein n=1 Tax=Ornithinimicrobium faecis TaxID=2934158 RepID=UPI0021197A6B|nr:VOC family protein [Ornithinimicrobium sp. HY1745]
MTPTPFVPGIDAAFLGVTDPQPHLDFYCGQLGFSVSERGLIPAAEAAALWGDGVGDTAVTVLSAAGSPHGRVVLLTVPSGGSTEHPHTADHGFVGIDLYVRDIQASHRELTAAGYEWATPPATWEVPLGEKLVTVTEGFCCAPEGTDVVFVEPASPRGTAAWEADPARAYTELTSVVCHVPDVDAEVGFWGPDGWGLSLWYDVSFSSPGLEEMAELPAGTTMRLAFLAGPETARIEVTRVENRTTGVDRRGQQRTGVDLGHSGWLVRTADLDAALERATERGGTVISGPLRGPQILSGGGRVAVVETPNGIRVTVREGGR